MEQRGAKLLGHGADSKLERLSSEDVNAVAAALKAATALRKLELRSFDMGLKECQALGNGLRGLTSLTALSLVHVRMGDQGAAAIFEVLHATTGSTLATLDLRGNGIGPEGVRAVAEYLMASASVTSVDVLSNRLNVESADLLLKVKVEKPNLRTLCGLTHNETKLNLNGRGLGPGDAKLLAPEILVMTSLTSLNLAQNNLGGDTGLIEATKVQGTSFNMGDKVIYEGREMMISQEGSSYIKMKPVDWLSGINAIADALRVSASLTVTDMRHNQLDTESATMLANVAKEKGISLCDIFPDQTEANMPGSMFGIKMGPADAILLTADLAVRASLTSVR